MPRKKPARSSGQPQKSIFVPHQSAPTDGVPKPRKFFTLHTGPDPSVRLPYSEIIVEISECSFSKSLGPFRRLGFDCNKELDECASLFSSLTNTTEAILREQFRFFNCDSTDRPVPGDDDTLNVFGDNCVKNQDTVNFVLDNASQEYDLTGNCMTEMEQQIFESQKSFIESLIADRRLSIQLKPTQRTNEKIVVLAVHGLVSHFDLRGSLVLVTQIHSLLQHEIARVYSELDVASPMMIDTLVYTHPFIFKYSNADTAIIMIKITALFTETKRDAEIKSFGFAAKVVTDDECNSADVAPNDTFEETALNRYATSEPAPQTMIHKIRNTTLFAKKNDQSLQPSPADNNVDSLIHANVSATSSSSGMFANEKNKFTDNESLVLHDDEDGEADLSDTRHGALSNYDAKTRKHWWRQNISWTQMKTRGKKIIKTAIEIGKISANM